MRSSLPQPIQDRLRSVLACPACGKPLLTREAGFACEACGEDFVREGTTEVLLGTKERDSTRRALERWAREALRPNISYKWLKRLMSPQVHRWGPERRWVNKWLATIRPGGLVVDVGCGGSESGDAIVRLDLNPGPEVDLAADAHHLPFQEGSVDAVLVVRVLEHVVSPGRVVQEVLRALAPGGLVMAVVPFLEPYHRNPADHSRFCRDGVERLFAGFEQLELAVATGPAIALAWMLKEWIAISFPFSNRPYVYAAVREAAGWALSPLAWVDPLLRRKTFAHKIAGSFWYVGRKPAAVAPGVSPQPP